MVAMRSVPRPLMFVSLLILILYFAIAPHSAPLEQYATLPDKVNHALAFGLLGAFAGYGLRTPSFAAPLAGLSALGMAVEIVQRLTPFQRSFDLADWAVSTAGAAAGLLCALLAIAAARAVQGRAPWSLSQPQR